MRLFINGVTAIARVRDRLVRAWRGKRRVSVTRQPGILDLASHAMETQKLIEK
ncbi:hypothetical protein GGE35_003605 [Rhizobium cellulosilyticum]|uniref:Uncharacterized protein n=1 Tax=Aliirhizobium cellulosilyticum TaxID=393664 RepID=A0A7W6SBM3_9HYPH|nr:hypothetical protein [Rhizobium cellulosilyticum]MBB4413292.1 hypothetical protein [Rhizobium cellulosilyticum]MBB4447770.1 hypothetical protein [Rhizobium cellulosilyticum]